MSPGWASRASLSAVLSQLPHHRPERGWKLGCVPQQRIGHLDRGATRTDSVSEGLISLLVFANSAQL
jgi:hypothetical protein